MDAGATLDADSLTAFAYAEHAGRLRALLARACPTIDDPDDIVQESFVRLLIALRSDRAPDSTAAWLSTVCLNLARSHGRHRQVVQRRLPAAIDPGMPAMPDHVVIASEGARAIGVAMGRLRVDGVSCERRSPSLPEPHSPSTRRGGRHRGRRPARPASSPGPAG